MPGSMMVTRAARRRRVGGLVLVAVVIGIAGGAVLTAAAGARRTASSLDRVRAESRAADVELDVTAATPDVTVPWVAVGAAALVTLVVVNLNGAVEATSAVRERPAAVLAVE